MGGLGFWFAGGLPETTTKARALEPDRPSTVSADPSDLEPTPNVARMRDLGDPTVREAAEPTTPASTSRPKELVRDFNGRGSLAGRASVQAGLDFPKRWTLHLEPSQSLSLAGRERAVTRDILVEAGEEFEVKDLPLGGYSVSARAPGLNGIPVDVALFKRQEHAYVMLRMTPAGFLDGGVVDSEGVPVEDLLVLLERAEDLTRSETRTDAAGNYIFQDVLDG
ncbi:MAG: carboxypeptidase-like regulatory domain-containing protein, partial [Planctomycetota bacterium]